MSQSCVYLPSYVLDYLDDDLTRLDSDAFLSKATPARLLEIILVFYPHFRFTQKAQEDHELLRNIFNKLVALRFSNITVKSQSDTRYIQAPLLRFPSCLVEESPRTINSNSDINLERIRMFNIYGLSHLKIGQYCLAAESLAEFIKIYHYLTEDEIAEISATQDRLDDTVQDTLTYLKEAYQSIELSQLHLSQSDLSSTKRHELELQLKSGITMLRSRHKTFDRAVQDVGFIAGLTEYHEQLQAQKLNTPSASKPSSTQDSRNEDPAALPE